MLLHAPMCAQPGIASVYSSIVQQTRSGVEFYIRAFPDLEGLTYGAARRAFPVRATTVAVIPVAVTPCLRCMMCIGSCCAEHRARCTRRSGAREPAPPLPIRAAVATYLHPDTQLDCLHSLCLAQLFKALGGL